MRDRERQTDRDRDRERQRQKQRETERETERDENLKSSKIQNSPPDICMGSSSSGNASSNVSLNVE